MKKIVFAALLAMIMLACAAALADGMVTVELSDAGCTSAGSGVTVTSRGVKITAPGDYLLAGSLSDGQVEVDCASDGRVTLYLNGVTIHNSTGPAILVGECSPRLVISLVEGTENRLSDGTNLVFTDGDEPNGVIFSKSDLTIEGSGALTVTSGALDGIVSKDDLKIKAGRITVNAARHGVKGKDFVEISGGTLTVTAGKDGIKSTNKDDPDRGYIALTGGYITLRCADDALSYVTYCTVEECTLRLEAVN